MGGAAAPKNLRSARVRQALLLVFPANQVQHWPVWSRAMARRKEAPADPGASWSISLVSRMVPFWAKSMGRAYLPTPYKGLSQHSSFQRAPRGSGTLRKNHGGSPDLVDVWVNGSMIRRSYIFRAPNAGSRRRLSRRGRWLGGKLRKTSPNSVKPVLLGRPTATSVGRKIFLGNSRTTQQKCFLSPASVRIRNPQIPITRPLELTLKSP